MSEWCVTCQTCVTCCLNGEPYKKEPFQTRESWIGKCREDYLQYEPEKEYYLERYRKDFERVCRKNSNLIESAVHYFETCKMMGMEDTPPARFAKSLIEIQALLKDE